MNNNIILAKSDGTRLEVHLQHVAQVAKIIARHIGVDKQVVEAGAILHDIGKVHPDFQSQLNSSGNTDEYVYGIRLRHEIVSILFLPLFPESLWNNLIEFVIAHHRSPSSPQNSGNGIIDLVEREGQDKIFRRHSVGWDNWSPIGIKILSTLGIKEKIITLDDAKKAFNYTVDYCESVSNGWSELKGLLNQADYMVSALGKQINHVRETLFVEPDLSRFDAVERKSKLFPLSLIDVNSYKKHSLVIAPTGAGKTDFLFRRCKGRVFYTLPFQASINAMYHRLKEFLPKDTDIRLLHATSSLQVENEEKYEEVVMQSLAGAAIKILTPHQLAALISGTKGFEAIALDIRACDVILDEIHSYSDISQAMVMEIVEVLIKLDCRIHIGSATMPSALTKMLVEILGGEKNVFITRLEESELEKFNRHRIIKHDDDSCIAEIINDAVEKNQKILVVCNRVNVAQQRFDYCKELYPKIPKLLLHSRFKRKDRAEKEKILMNEAIYRNINPNSFIVVSTQVVEVSLDIDFDVMITDAAPIDSLIQRFGRINRKRSYETIEQKIIKDIHIIAPPDNAKDIKPYKKDIVDASFVQFQNGELLEEQKIQEKIDKVYPNIDIQSIKTRIVWQGNDFLLKRLNHLPKAKLIELLNIESATAILLSDKEKYEQGNVEDRIKLEIPVPRSIKFRNIPQFGFSEYGTKPIIVSDELYSKEKGLIYKEINNIL